MVLGFKVTRVKEVKETKRTVPHKELLPVLSALQMVGWLDSRCVDASDLVIYRMRHVTIHTCLSFKETRDGDLWNLPSPKWRLGEKLIVSGA